MESYANLHVEILSQKLLPLKSSRNIQKSTQVKLSQILSTVQYIYFSGKIDPAYTVLDQGPIRQEYPVSFQKDMDFVRSMLDLVKAYRNFDISQHPAILKRMQDRENEMKESESSDVRDEL